MKEENQIKNINKRFHKNMSWIWLSYILGFAIVSEFIDFNSSLQFFILIMIFGLIDLWLTHNVVFKKGNTDESREMNFSPRLLMKVFKRKWWIPAYIIMGILFYFLAFKSNLISKMFFLGVYFMVLFSNTSIYYKEWFFNKNHLEQKIIKTFMKYKNNGTRRKEI